MADKAPTTIDGKVATDGAPPAAVPPKRSPGHRGADVRDTVAEMAAKAQEISQEAGSKMAAAMKDVISAASGLTGFAIESARDLVQFMVRRGQMTQEEADKLIREAEEADGKRKPHPVLPPSKQPKPPPVVRVEGAVSPMMPPPLARPTPRVEPPVRAAAPAPKKAAPAAKAKKKPAARPAAKAKTTAKGTKKKGSARR
jgi:polyhydroxyalkanoate synthesis regulator phasin